MVRDRQSRFWQQQGVSVEQALAEPYPEAFDARTRVYESPDLDAAVPWTRRPIVGYEDVAATVRRRGAG